MSPHLYEHERHPLDIAAEEETKAQERQQKKQESQLNKISDLTQDKLNTPYEEWQSLNLTFEVAQHLGREYWYSGNKIRKKAGWPVTREEMITFLEEHGLKQ